MIYSFYILIYIFNDKIYVFLFQSISTTSPFYVIIELYIAFFMVVLVKRATRKM